MATLTPVQSPYYGCRGDQIDDKQTDEANNENNHKEGWRVTSGRLSGQWATAMSHATAHAIQESLGVRSVRERSGYDSASMRSMLMKVMKKQLDMTLILHTKMAALQARSPKGQDDIA
ncbi:hypothetical protein GN956_G13639 [Arapaima gigas]